jgi:hypothetical protein
MIPSLLETTLVLLPSALSAAAAIAELLIQHRPQRSYVPDPPDQTMRRRLIVITITEVTAEPDTGGQQ